MNATYTDITRKAATIRLKKIGATGGAFVLAARTSGDVVVGQPDQPVTQLLASWRGGNQAALGELTGLVYQELRSLGAKGQRMPAPLSPTASIGTPYIEFTPKGG